MSRVGDAAAAVFAVGCLALLLVWKLKLDSEWRDGWLLVWGRYRVVLLGILLAVMVYVFVQVMVFG